MKTLSPQSLPTVLHGIEHHRYVVMKTLPAPVPETGSDIDLLCDDAVAMGRQLVRNCRPLIAQGYEIRVRDLPESGQTHIDLMDGGMILLRLDLHEGLRYYPNLKIRETYAARLLNRRQWTALDTPDGVVRLAVPDKTDNLVLRYLEYHAFFDRRPDKIKHAEAIAEETSDNPSLHRTFLDRLAEATTTRPATPLLHHCDINLKRQLTWAIWSVRDKLAWRLAWCKQVAVLLLTEPGLFLRKLANKFVPQQHKRRLHSEAH